MSSYRAVWPIEDQTATTWEMRKFALAELAEMLEMAGLCIAGEVTWRRASTDFIAEVPVVREEPEIEGDMRPWMSRRGQAEELGWAA